jgi:hypothetical protein
MTKKNKKSIDAMREHHANNYQGEEPMGYVIKLQPLQPRAGDMTMYIGAVPDHDDKANVADNLEEASKCPWPTVEKALEVVSGLPGTENLDCEIVPAQ